MTTDSRELEERALKAYQEAEARMKEAFSEAWKAMGVAMDQACYAAQDAWRAIQAEIDKAREEGVIPPPEEARVANQAAEIIATHRDKLLTFEDAVRMMRQISLTDDEIERQLGRRPIDREPVEKAGEAGGEAPGDREEHPPRHKRPRQRGKLAGAGAKRQEGSSTVDNEYTPESPGSSGGEEAGDSGDHLPDLAQGRSGD